MVSAALSGEYLRRSGKQFQLLGALLCHSSWSLSLHIASLASLVHLGDALNNKKPH